MKTMNIWNQRELTEKLIVKLILILNGTRKLLKKQAKRQNYVNCQNSSFETISLSDSDHHGDITISGSQKVNEYFEFVPNKGETISMSDSECDDDINVSLVNV